MSDYPVPSYAASIWIAGDKLMLGFPSTVGGREHSVALPMSDKGLAVALDIIKERNATSLKSIGHRGAPSQWNIENDARYNAFIRATKKNDDEKAAATKFLEELGL